MLRLVEPAVLVVDPQTELGEAIDAMKRAEWNPLLTEAESRALVAHRKLLETALGVRAG